MSFKFLGKPAEHIDHGTDAAHYRGALLEAADFLDAYYEFNPFEPQRNKKLGIEWMGTFKGSDEALDFLRNNLRVSAGSNNEAGETPVDEFASLHGRKSPRGSGASEAPERG